MLLFVSLSHKFLEKHNHHITDAKLPEVPLSLGIQRCAEQTVRSGITWD